MVNFSTSPSSSSSRTESSTENSLEEVLNGLSELMSRETSDVYHNPFSSSISLGEISTEVDDTELYDSDKADQARHPRIKHSEYQYDMLRYKVNCRSELQSKNRRRRQRQTERPSNVHIPQQAGTVSVFRLLDFPTELILNIMELCDFDGLHSLTMTSRYFCNIVFPIFLTKSGLLLPKPNLFLSGHSSQDTQHGMIDIATPEQALALCVWKRQESFHCVAVLNFTLDLVPDLTSAVVDRVLAFYGSPFPFQTPFTTMINIYISSVQNVSADACRLIYGLQNSECSRLSITGLTRLHDIPNLLSDRFPLMEPTDEGFRKLEVFHACGTFPFLPHMLAFTMHNLLTSNLKELDLTLNGFCLGKWTRFLRNLFFPNLEGLSLGGSISINSLLRFLRRHRALRRLSLCGISVPFSPPRLYKAFSLSIPNLEFVRAPCLYLTEILKQTRRSPGVITRIVVLTDFYRPFSIENSANLRRSAVKALLREAKNFSSIETMEFHFAMSESMQFCTTSGELMPPEMYVSSVNTLSLHKSGGQPLENSALAKTIEWISLFPNIHFVELWESCRRDRSEWASSLCAKGILPVIHSIGMES